MTTTPSGAPTAEDVRVRAADVAALPWRPWEGAAHVDGRVLWRSGDSRAGMLRLGPGAVVGRHVHPQGHHHVYVVEGTCLVDGDALPAGSYAHVPAGRPHTLGGQDPGGCVVFYTFVDEPAGGR